jgi:hypothetical protein
MLETLQEAVTVLRGAGLAVSVTTFNSLQIGSSLDDVGEGLHVFRDGSALNPRNGEWVVLLPAGGLLQYEVPGTLAEGVALMLAAYQDHRKNGGLFHEACKRVLGDADRYLIGRSLAGV